MNSSLLARSARWYVRLSTTAAIGALALLTSLATPAAAASPAATDVFNGSAVIPAGQTSPVRVDPADITFRADGAVGVGYRYEATGQAVGELPGQFDYNEHGYLYFRNPADPRTMVGSRFVSGVFTLTTRERTVVHVADTAPDAYTSGLRMLSSTDLPGHLMQQLQNLLMRGGSLAYSYFTFTNNHGTFTGYATPDFTRFMITITFDRPAAVSE